MGYGNEGVRRQLTQCNRSPSQDPSWASADESAPLNGWRTVNCAGIGRVLSQALKSVLRIKGYETNAPNARRT
jgi:hypothetical protein